MDAHHTTVASWALGAGNGIPGSGDDFPIINSGLEICMTRSYGDINYRRSGRSTNQGSLSTLKDTMAWSLSDSPRES